MMLIPVNSPAANAAKSILLTDTYLFSQKIKTINYALYCQDPGLNKAINGNQCIIK